MISVNNRQFIINDTKLKPSERLMTLETHNHFWGLNIMKTFDNKLYLKNKT